MKSEEVEPTKKRIWKRSWRWYLTDEIHIYIKLRKGFENSSGKLEESGKILGKDLWVRAHSKETLLKDFKERLHRLKSEAKRS